MGIHDDDEGIGHTMGAVPGTNFIVDIMVSTPFVVAVINSVIAGVIATLVAEQLDLATPLAVILAIVAGAAVFGLQAVVATRGIATAVATFEPMFPKAAPDASQ